MRIYKKRIVVQHINTSSDNKEKSIKLAKKSKIKKKYLKGINKI